MAKFLAMLTQKPCLVRPLDQYIMQLRAVFSFYHYCLVISDLSTESILIKRYFITRVYCAFIIFYGRFLVLSFPFINPNSIALCAD